MLEDSKNLFTGPSEASVEERRYYLEIFLRKLSQFPYLINGEECQIFFRHPADLQVGIELIKCMPLPAVEQYTRISKAIQQDEISYTEDMIQRFDDQISEFKLYATKVDPQLRSLDSELTTMIVHQKRSVAAYADMQNVLEAYEEQNLQQYVGVDVYQLVLNNPENTDIKNRLAQLSEEIVSTFVDLQHWARGELYDLESMLAAIKVRDEVVKKTAAIKKKVAKAYQDTELTSLDKNS